MQQVFNNTCVLQQRAINDVVNLFQNGETAVLLQAITGSGKTYMTVQTFILLRKLNLVTRAIIVVPCQPLLKQYYQTCEALGLKVAVYHGTMTGFNDPVTKARFRYNQMRNTPDADVCITLPDTFATLVGGKNYYGFPNGWAADFILNDEAHKNTSSSSQAVRNRFPNALMLGATATCRRETNEEGEHLYDWYGDNLVVAASGQEMVDAGRIVAPQYHHFNENDHLVNSWLALTDGEKEKGTVVVCRDLYHAFLVKEAFVKSGVSGTKLLTSDDIRDPNNANNIVHPVQSEAQRLQIQDEFRAGLFDVLVSVGTVCEGFDAPRAHYVIIDREITAMALFFQIVGRVLRPYEGKTYGHVLDFGGNFGKYGCILEKEWSVEDYGPETNGVTSTSSVSAAKWHKARRMMVKCGCNHVFDAKKRKSCNRCNTPHSIRISDKVKSFLSINYNVDSNAFLAQRDQIAMVASTRSYITRDGKKVQAKNHNEFKFMRIAINDMFGAEVLDVENGGFNPTHKDLEHVVRNKIGVTKVISYAAA